MGKSSGKVTIKKYANRRLYDTESSSYITLDRLGAMIREGRDFEVIDAKSGDDITHQVLTQIIVEEESRGEGATMLPVRFLRQLIGLYGGKMQSAVPQYLDAAMDMFSKNQAAMRDAVGGAVGTVPFNAPTIFADLAKRNMAMFEEAGRAFVPGAAAKKAAAPESDEHSEVDKLRAELAALQAKVDKLGTKPNS
jgi:polyhydroxyalkanoate synthesis repressor PhaR